MKNSLWLLLTLAAIAILTLFGPVDRMLALTLLAGWQVTRWLVRVIHC